MRNKAKINAWCAGWVAGWNAQATMKKAVRCYECKHMVEVNQNGYMCVRWIGEHPTTPDKFCAWGEPRES